MKDIKFAVRHKESKQWVRLWFGIRDDRYIHLMDIFCSEILYSARNIIEEDLAYTQWGDGKGFVDPKEFEIVKIEITYKIPD
jgi:hypothetical protein